METIKDETFKKVINDYHNYLIRSDGSPNLNDSISSNIEYSEKESLADKLCLNIEKY